MNKTVRNSEKRIGLSIMMIFVILLFSSCFQKRDVTGTYIAEVRFMDCYTDEMNQKFRDEGLGFFLDIPLRVQFDLYSDTTFQLFVDVDDLKQKVNKGIDDNIGEFCERILADEGIEPGDYDEVTRLAGYGNYEGFKEETAKKIKEKLEEDDSAWDSIAAVTKGIYSVKRESIVFNGYGNSFSFDRAEINSDGSFTINTLLEESDKTIVMVFMPQQ